MIVCQRIAIFAAALAASVTAESPADAVRRAMEASVARQAASVAAMRISVARQRGVLRGPAQAPSQAQEAGRGRPFFTLSWPATGACDPMPEDEVGALLREAAGREGLDEGLLRAVAEEESGLRPCAVSRKGAMGLMQLMPATVAELGVRDPFDPRENLFSGARFLKQLLTRFGGDAALALGAYNAGPGHVEETGGVPPIPETVRYVREILARLPQP